MDNTQQQTDRGWRWLQAPWWFVRTVFQALNPARFSFVVIVVGTLVSFGVPQGVEILRSLAEGDQYHARFDSGSTLRIFYFGAALLLWAFNSWYWARVLLNARFPDSLSAETIGKNPFRWLRTQGPRLMGIAPLVIIAAAFFTASYQYASDARGNPRAALWVMGTSCLGLAALFYIFCIGRRDWLTRAGETPPGAAVAANTAGTTALRDHRFQSLRHLRTENAASFWVVVALALFSVLLLVLFTTAPVQAASHFGAGAILLCAASVWVCFGSCLVYLSSRYQLPLTAVLLLLAALCSIVNDNHAIRVLGGVPPIPPAAGDTASADVGGPVAQAFVNWHARVQREHPMKSRPVFIAAAAGGGIRAAYWTATVLGTLEDRSLEQVPGDTASANSPAPPDFASHLFAISGVSGGSLGAAVFDALVAEKKLPANQSFASEAQGILGEDFLSPTLASMLFPDLVQRFFPWPVRAADRGAVLEEAWERGWRNWLGPQSDRFAQPLRALWSPDLSPGARDGGHVPALFLNGTVVQTGKRVVASNLPVTSGDGAEFIDIGDLHAMLGPQGQNDASLDTRLSTAAHMSARFTYVSPAGLLPGGEHVVDGGYFENSGAATALEIVHVIKEVIREHDRAADWPDRVIPVVLIIDNAPVVLPGPLSAEKALSAPPPASTRTAKPQPSKAPHVPPVPTWQDRPPAHSVEFLNELLDPLSAMMNTRDARGSFSEQAVSHEQGYLPYHAAEKSGAPVGAPAPPSTPPAPEVLVLNYQLRQRRVPLPLGWMLSGGAAIEMREQIDTDDLEDKTNVQRVCDDLRHGFGD